MHRQLSPQRHEQQLRAQQPDPGPDPGRSGGQAFGGHHDRHAHADHQQLRRHHPERLDQRGEQERQRPDLVLRVVAVGAAPRPRSAPADAPRTATPTRGRSRTRNTRRGRTPTRTTAPPTPPTPPTAAADPDQAVGSCQARRPPPGRPGGSASRPLVGGAAGPDLPAAGWGCQRAWGRHPVARPRCGTAPMAQRRCRPGWCGVGHAGGRGSPTGHVPPVAATGMTTRLPAPKEFSASCPGSARPSITGGSGPEPTRSVRNTSAVNRSPMSSCPPMVAPALAAKPKLPRQKRRRSY